MGDTIFRLFPNERYMDLTLVQYGREQCSPNHTFGPAIRNHYLFHLILSGKGVLLSNDSHGHTNTYHLSAGMGFLIYPAQVNTYIADETHPWEYAWLEFDGLKAPDIVSSSGLSMDMPIYRSRDKELNERMKEELLSIANSEPHSSLSMIGHLYLFLDLLVSSSFNHTELSAGKLKDLYIREAVTFIEQNYYRSNITVEDIARFCNLNQNYLGKIFKDSMNQTLQHFLIYFRMNKAAEFLKHSNMSVGEISKLVGYQNQLNFSRAFKKIFGLSPAAWRKENQLLPKR